MKIIEIIFCVGKMLYIIIEYWKWYIYLFVLFFMGSILDKILDISSKEIKIFIVSVFIFNVSDGRKWVYL